MKKDQKQAHDAGRRSFLRGSAATGLGVAVAASLPTTTVAAEVTAETDDTSKGYRLSRHVLDYYKTLTS